jgi:hypothetical protein
MRVVTLTTTVTPKRTLTIPVPQDIPTLGDLRTSRFFGMWRDRTDLPDSPVLARMLREQAWKRSRQ